MEAQSLKQKYDEEQFERLQLGIFGVELPRPVAEVTLPFVTARGNENLQAIMRDGEDAASVRLRRSPIGCRTVRDTILRS
jgi:hypothetical protein